MPPAAPRARANLSTPAMQQPEPPAPARSAGNGEPAIKTFLYALGEHNLPLQTQEEALAYLERLHLPVNPNRELCRGINVLALLPRLAGAPRQAAL